MTISLSQISIKDSDNWWNLINSIYPVGAIYMSMVNISPAQIFGGTWEQYSDQRFFLPATSAGWTGGSQFITIDNMPAHSHNPSYGGSFITTSGGNLIMNFAAGSYQRTHDPSTTSVGGGASYWPQYRACLVWHRVA